MQQKWPLPFCAMGVLLLGACGTHTIGGAVRHNQSEAALFGSISEASYEVNELKVDVFGDAGIAMYYPEASFVRGGEHMESNGRQTLVLPNTSAGWKLIHEHGTGR